MERIKEYLMTAIFSKEEMKTMEDMLAHFLGRMNLQLAVPVDVFKVATDLGFDVRGAEFTGCLEGIIYVDERIDKIKGFDSNKIIGYNCSKDIHTKKFIVAHELAHYISEKSKAYDASIIVAAREHESGYSDNKIEQSMDYIAASILIPQNDLRQFIKRTTDVGSSQVAERYNVPEALASRRIEEVKLLTRHEK